MAQVGELAAAQRLPAARGWRPGGLDWAAVVFSVPAVAFTLALFIYPFLYGLDLSLRPEGGLTLANYVAFFDDPRQVQTIRITFQAALPVTILNVLLAIPLAVYLRRGLAHEKLITTILVLPVTLGTVLIAEGMLTYFGPRGWFNQAVQLLPWVTEPVRLTHNMLGVQLSLLLQGFPFSFLLLLGYVSGIDPDLERAARMLGASRWEAFRRVTLPLMAPGIAIAFSLGFVANFSVFPSAVLVGQPSGPTRVISIAAFQAAFEQFNWSMGSTIAIIMAAIELVVIALVLAWRERLYRGAASGAAKG
jgi:putative spermidine/putrescine transport system permease protein